MDRQQLERSVRRKLRASPATDRVVAAILADADDYAAFMVEQCAHPDYSWMNRVRGAGSPAEREEAAVVAELPGGEV